MNRTQIDRNLYRKTYDSISASAELKEELIEMMHTQSRKKNSCRFTWTAKAAAAVMVFLILGATSVFAAEKLNIFGGLFGSSDTSSVEEYVATTDPAAQDRDAEGVYTAENETWSVSVEQFMYNKATKYAVVQFTVVNKTGDGRRWFNTAEWNELYEDWEKTDATQIFIGKDDIDYLWFRAENGLNLEAGRVYMQQLNENTFSCQLLVNPCRPGAAGNGLPRLIVCESEGEGVWNEILRMDIPVGESLPCLRWEDENGGTRLLLSAVDFLIADAPECSINEIGEIIPREISVQFSDGSEAVILSESAHILHEFYGKLSEKGLWSCFDRVIDLENVVSFTFDGEVFYTNDAVPVQ